MSVPDAARHASKKLIIESYLCIGYNYRMTDLQAAVGIEQMKRLDAIVTGRRELAARYTAALADHPWLEPPFVPAYAEPNFQSYAVRLRDDAPLSRNELLGELRARGIAAKPGIMTAHREPAYREQCAGLRLPVTEKTSDRSFLLPLYPDLAMQQQDAIVAELHDAFAARPARRRIAGLTRIPGTH